MTDPRRTIPASATVSRWITPDGWPLRRFDWPATDSRGVLVFQPGRADVFEKYLEAFAHWHAAGWSIVAFDWRGHGGSGRPPLDVAHGEFATAIRDLAAVWRTLPRNKPRVLLGHSMGGFLALRAAVEQAVDPDALVLVAPMLGLRSPLGRFSAPVSRFLRDRGDPARLAWKTNERPDSRVARQPLLTTDVARYADETWWHAQAPDHAPSPPSWAWLAESFEATGALARDPRLATLAPPVLLLVADHDGLVDARAAVKVATRLRGATLLRFGPESAHEILREADPVRDRALSAIDAFLARMA
ncbi:alpha/beta fold hydrolase [Sphingomonas sp.]|uniref:alpha/beta fold hydrolase n=1 Tax=Sphingomonas sp. TaxID=28214 RepID=UPI0035BC1085